MYEELKEEENRSSYSAHKKINEAEFLNSINNKEQEYFIPSFYKERKVFKIIDFIFYRILFNWWLWILCMFVNYQFILTDSEIKSKHILLFILTCTFAITGTFKRQEQKIINKK